MVTVCIGLCYSGTVFPQTLQDNKDPAGMQDSRKKPGESAHLTDAQKAAVKAILSKYDASALTADTAKAIHKAFRDAGIPGGPGENEAVSSAGFDPHRLRDLDPPPDKKAP